MRYKTILKSIITLAVTIFSVEKSIAHKDNIDYFILKGHPNIHADKTQLTQLEEEYLRNFKTIKIGITEPNFHPYDIINKESNYYQGISADFLQLVKESLRINVEIIRFKIREDAIKAVKTGKVDLLTTANSYEEIQGLILSTPYLSDRPTLFKNIKPDSEIKKISIAYDYLPINEINNYFPDKKIITHPTTQSAIAAAAFGNTDAVIIDLSSANYMVNNTFYKKIQLHQYLKIDSKGTSFASIKEKSQLIDIFNKAIKKISRDKNRLIRQRWSGGGYIIPEKSDLPSFTNEEQKWIKENKQVNFVFNEHMAPLSYLNSSGNPAGYAIEILELLRLYSGLDIKYTATKNFHEQQKLVLKNERPYITILTPNINREPFFTFSSEFSNSPYIVVQKKNNNNNNPTLAIPKGHAIEEYSRNYFNFKEIKLTSNFIEALDAVKNGEVNYTLMPLNIADYYKNSYFSDYLEIKEMVNNIPLATANFAFKKDEQILKNIINKTLLMIPPNELQILENYWRSNLIPTNQTWKDYRYTIYTILISSLILILMSYGWTIYTRRHFRQRLKATQALDEQLLFMQQIVDAIPHPIYVRNKDLNLILCNENYLSVVNSSQNVLLSASEIGKSIKIKELLLVEHDYNESIRTGEAIFKDREVYINNIKLTIYHWIKPYRDVQGNIEGVVGGWIDISERIQLLEDLKDAKNLAESANEAKSTFLATMSHEIRTPMNAIIGMLELALKSPNLPIAEINTIKVAYDSANGLLELIGDILDIARIEAGQLTLSPVRTNLKSIVSSVVRVFDGLAQQKGLTLELHFDDRIKNDVLVDPMRIKQILSNLIGNAIKFTNVGNIKVAVNIDNKKSYIFTVIDTGIGISQEDQIRLFKPFSQGQESHNKYGGTGLGLMISRSLCEMMGGKLELVSKLGLGTEIKMELQLTSFSDISKDVEKKIENYNKGKHSYNILIVDDHPANRLLLAQQLRFIGHTVIESENGQSAIELFKENEIQYIITDCNMPEMSGYELSKNIREIEEKNIRDTVVIIGYTANAQKDVKDACLLSGMNDCLFKPISLQELHDTLEYHHQIKNSEYPEINFSPEAVDKLTGNNSDLIIRLLIELTKSNKLDIDALIKAQQSMDNKKIKDIVHKIKGAARIIDAKKIISFCEKIEESNHNTLESDIESLIETLIDLDSEISDYILKVT